MWWAGTTFKAEHLHAHSAASTHMRMMFFTLKLSRGATSGSSPLSSCRTICWRILSRSCQCCRLPPPRLSESKYTLVMIFARENLHASAWSHATHRASAGSAGGWRGGVGRNLCGSVSSWSAQTWQQRSLYLHGTEMKKQHTFSLLWQNNELLLKDTGRELTMSNLFANSESSSFRTISKKSKCLEWKGTQVTSEYFNQSGNCCYSFVIMSSFIIHFKLITSWWCIHPSMHPLIKKTTSRHHHQTQLDQISKIPVNIFLKLLRESAGETAVVICSPWDHKQSESRVGYHSPVQSGVFMLSELVDDRLNAQHQKLVPQVEAKLQVVLKVKEETMRLQPKCKNQAFMCGCIPEDVCD